MHDILIVGVGYVGLVSGTCFAEMGNHVTCLDKNAGKIASLQEGHIPIYEPGLEEMVRRNAKAGRLVFTTNFKEAVEKADICMLAVDTPVGPDGACDLTSIKAATRQIAEVMNGYKVIVNKSTVPVGTSVLVRQIITEVLEKRGCTFGFDVVSNPEFLKEGSAIYDFMKPDRVVLGVETEKAAKTMRELYRPFMLGSDRVIVMDPASSELTKYAANTMLALRVSFMNWLSNLAEETGANILQIRKGIGSDKRIGNAFLWAGVGYGGSCFPKDIKALRQMAIDHGVDSMLIDSIEKINAHQKSKLATKIAQYFEPFGGLEDKTIGILGLAFKPDTDDMREAPSLVVINELLALGASVRLFDPVSMENAKSLLEPSDKITWCENELETATGAHALALITEWKQFRLLDFPTLLSRMQARAFFDGRNQYAPKEMTAHGFDYISIGQSPAMHLLAKEFLPHEICTFEEPIQHG
ncbi:MAG: UDP-glucose/GDP-mannose dehydrogenase family protein [Chlamydiales bacterium]|nr:UDP-glucose/GDP-mannose dehydrogenase family protein [Chlamydiales bacterium]